MKNKIVHAEHKLIANWILKLFSKKLFLLLVLNTLLFPLAGCASLSAQQRDLKTTCESSRVLFTDLMQPPSNRCYMLPDGRVCSNKGSINYK